MAARPPPHIPRQLRRRRLSRLPRSFYARSALEVAPDLLGNVFVRRLSDGRRLSAMIVEVEAYTQTDPASHAFRGRTVRNAVMFGAPGHLYVYFTYGMHFCMNVVTGNSGHGEAVLLRAGEPIDGVHAMTERRASSPPADLCRGPARWTKAFGVDRTLDGADLVRGSPVWIEQGGRSSLGSVRATPRVGIKVATSRPWRFVLDGSAWASGTGALTRRRRPDPSPP